MIDILKSFNIFHAIGLSMSAHIIFLNFLPGLPVSLPDERENKVEKVRLEIIKKPKPKKEIINKPVQKRLKKRVQKGKPIPLAKTAVMKKSISPRIKPALARPITASFANASISKPAAKVSVSNNNFSKKNLNIKAIPIKRTQNNNILTKAIYSKRKNSIGDYSKIGSSSIVPRKFSSPNSIKSFQSGRAVKVLTRNIFTSSFRPAVRAVNYVDKTFGKEGNSVTTDEFNKIWGQYTHSIQLKIAKAKTYPALARERNQQGKAFLSFKLNKAGEILELLVENSSGHEILDEAAIKAIKEAAPFPNIPESLNKNFASLKIPISFVLR